MSRRVIKSLLIGANVLLVALIARYLFFYEHANRNAELEQLMNKELTALKSATTRP